MEQIRDIIATATKSQTEYRFLTLATISYLHRLGVPSRLQDRVKLWLSYTWQQQKTLGMPFHSHERSTTCSIFYGESTKDYFWLINRITFFSPFSSFFVCLCVCVAMWKNEDERKILNLLPKSMKAEIALNIHVETLGKVQLFQSFDTAFLRDLVVKLRSIIILPGDFVCRKVRKSWLTFYFCYDFLFHVTNNPLQIMSMTQIRKSACESA